MKNFPITKLEIISSANDDDTVYSLLKSLYKGKVYFGIANVGFKGLLVWKSRRYMNADNYLIAVYEIKEYK